MCLVEQCVLNDLYVPNVILQYLHVAAFDEIYDMMLDECQVDDMSDDNMLGFMLQYDCHDGCMLDFA